MRLVKRRRLPCSSRRRSLTRGALSSTVPVPKVSLRPWPRPLRTQRASLLVALAAMALDVIVGLRLKRFDQHPPGALARDLIQRQKLLTGFPRSRLLDYLQHRLRPPSTRLPPGFALLTQKGTPPFSCRLDPQLLVIARQP